MRILVIDDSAIHQAAAKAQLRDHNTTVVGSYDEGEKLLQEKHEFEMVLVDLLMPPSLKEQGEGLARFIGQEMPVGIFLALLAAKNGAKYVAVFTDSSHHEHPGSACLDAFNARHCVATPFTVEGAKVILSNTFEWINLFRPNDMAKPTAEEVLSPEEKQNDTRIWAKNWRAILEYFTATA